MWSLKTNLFEMLELQIYGIFVVVVVVFCCRKISESCESILNSTPGRLVREII